MLPPDGVFHPKTLVFGSKGNGRSSSVPRNLTRSGLSKNAELTIHLSSDDQDDAQVYSEARHHSKWTPLAAAPGLFVSGASAILLVGSMWGADVAKSTIRRRSFAP
jgi:hypothetical protein